MHMYVYFYDMYVCMYVLMCGCIFLLWFVYIFLLLSIESYIHLTKYTVKYSFLFLYIDLF